MNPLDDPGARVRARLLDADAAGGGSPGRDDVVRLVAQEAPLLGPAQQARLVDAVVAEIAGLGPLESLLADPAITDVMVNGGGSVWIERAGVVRRLPIQLSTSAVEHLIEKVVAPLGLRVDRSSPLVDARLADGSRVNAVVPPLAVDGPCLTIRRFAPRVLPLEAFASEPVAALLAWAVRSRLNVLVSGGTGAGKTTLLNSMAAHIAPDERVVTIEDAAELALPGSHIVRLEARPANAEGVGAVRLRELVRNALRMRPDRILVGEVRGPEALDMLQAMNTGHDGSLSTCHANSPLDALHRIETMVLMGEVDLPLAALGPQVDSAIDLVVQVARGRGGRRVVVAVAEVRPAWSDGEGLADPRDSQPTRVGRVRLLADGSGLLEHPCRPPRWPDAGPFDPPGVGFRAAERRRDLSA